MLDDILEVVLEIVLDGVVSAAESKRVPMPIRIGLIALLVVLWLGVVGLVLWAGIDSGSVLLILLGALLFFGAAVWGIYKIRKFSRR